MYFPDAFIFSLIFLLNSPLLNCEFIKVGCNDYELSINCQCYLDNLQNNLEMKCNSMLNSLMNKLPAYSVATLKVINSFNEWPKIPHACKNTIALILGDNQIKSIGDLTNLAALQFLNLSNNRISKIESSIGKLKQLHLLDLSFNLLEVIHFENFIINSDRYYYEPANEIFSKLECLLLNGNRIKQIYNLDTAFIGMPILSILQLDSNMIKTVEIPYLSQHSLNIIFKAKQALSKNSTYLQFISASRQNNYNYYYGFNYNWITRVHFNFQEIFKDLFEPYAHSFLNRFLSIYIISENSKVACDCEIYKDLSFLVRKRAEAFGNEQIPRNIEKFSCFKQDSANLQNLTIKKSNQSSNTKIGLFRLINKDSVKYSDFCDESKIPGKASFYWFKTRFADVLNWFKTCFNRILRWFKLHSLY